MSEARDNILKRLRGNRVSYQPPRREAPPARDWSVAQRIEHFTQCQRAVHGEVHRVPRQQWINWLAVELPKRGLQRTLTGTGEIGEQLAKLAIRGIDLCRYDSGIETWKSELFSGIDVAITSARCGIAETGSLVLWPDPDEPRLMSLVPPVHIALLEADSLYDTFAQMIEAENWSQCMPTNALLISGPSKTADIEQTLAYGIHGPKQLITLILV